MVKLRLADGRIPNLVGHINFEAARLDPNTGTVTLRARLPNPEGLLKSGQFVRVLVTGATRPNAIAIPQKAVLEGPQGKFVYVLGESEEGQTVAQFRPIEVGEWIGKDKERDWIIRNGLQAGDRVILDNLIKVRPGAPVSIASPAPPANTTNDAG